MYKLIIVDDEQKIRTGIAAGIPWDELGFMVTGVCANGLEALQIIEKDCPNVVLSDIRMPLMDGIELMQIINQRYPHIKVIILSGFNDFEYLNMSIKNRVIEYLLKPTDVDEFKAVFKGVKEQLDLEEEQRREYDTLNRVGKEARLRMGITKLLHGFYGSRDFGEVPVFEQGFLWSVMLLQITETDENDSTSYYKMYEEVTKACNNFSSNPSSYTGAYIWNYDEYLIGILWGREEEGGAKSLYEYAEALKEYLIRKFPISITIGVSSLVKEIKMLAECYRQSICCINQKVLMNTKNRILFYSDLPDKNEDQYSRFFNEEKLLKCVIGQDKVGIEEELERFFFGFRGKAMKDVGYVDQISVASLYHIVRKLKNYGLLSLEHIKVSVENYAESSGKYDLEGKQQALKQVFLQISDEFLRMQEKNKKSSSLVKEIRGIIDKEFSDNMMSLEYVAERVRKHPTYISTLFKEELGCRFSDYVVQKRLDKSLELLQDSKIKIYEISKGLGWADVSNFIRMFKRRYGMSPNEYRNLSGKG